MEDEGMWEMLYNIILSGSSREVSIWDDDVMYAHALTIFVVDLSMYIEYIEEMYHCNIIRLSLFLHLLAFSFRFPNFPDPFSYNSEVPLPPTIRAAMAYSLSCTPCLSAPTHNKSPI